MTSTRMLVVGALVLAATTSAWAGKIVVANDEWQTSNTGFANTPTGSAQFVRNVADFFAAGPTGSFLVVSDNFSLDLDQATSFASTLTTAGHTVTDSEDISGFVFDAATMGGFDGVFLALPPTVNQAELIAYVNLGGNVYLNAGTGFGGSAAEAAAWNTFLNAFGLSYASVYNGVGGNIPIVSSHAVMAGVSSLYQNNGNSISLVGGNPFAQIVASSVNGEGLYAVYDSAATVPEPATLFLMSVAAAGTLLRRRRA